MGQRDEENPVSEDEAEAEKQNLRSDVVDDMEMQKIPIKTKDAGYPEVIVGQDDPLIKSHHLKYMLFVFNFFVSLFGLALLAITIWMRADNEFTEYEDTLAVSNFKAVCAMLIVAGLVVLVVGVLGCVGAATENRWLLIAYMGLFGLIFLLEVAAIAIMWSAPYSKTINAEIEKQIQKQIAASQNGDDSSRYFMDFIQEHLYCCGATGVNDYDWIAPNSCQDPRTGDMFTSGCASKMLTYLRSKAGIVGGVALPIIFIQLIALVASACLIRSIEVESRYFMRDAR